MIKILRQCYIKDDLCYIPLQNGQEAFTDKEYYDIVSKHNWHQGNKNKCVMTRIKNKIKTLPKLLFKDSINKIIYLNKNTLDNTSKNIFGKNKSENILLRRECFIKDNICYIPLANIDKLAMCDADRFDEVSKYNWYIIDRYVATWLNHKNKRLHRFLYPEWKMIDHINHDTFDNTSKNLREATHNQNMHNRIKSKNNKSGYKGVSFDKKKMKYIAQIILNNISYFLGTYTTPEEAAEAYNKKAIELHGEFACLNVIPKKKKSIF